MSSRRIKLIDKGESDTLYQVSGIDKFGEDINDLVLASDARAILSMYDKDDAVTGIIRVEIVVQYH